MKQLVAVFLVVCAVAEFGLSETLSRKCGGTNKTWTLDLDTGALRISPDPKGKASACRIPYPEVVRSIVIEEGVIDVRPGEFAGFINLESVKFPDSLRTIESDGFRGCTSLKSVKIGKGTDTIFGTSFAQCTSLTTFEVDSQNDYFTVVDNVLFSSDKEFIAQYPCGKRGAYTIPDSVKYADGYAFNGCPYLTSLTFAKNQEYLDEMDFNGCESLTNLAVNAGDATYVSEDGVIFNKEKTTLVLFPPGRKGTYTIPASVTSINDIALDGCNKLTRIDVDPSNNNYSSSSDGVLFSKDTYTLVRYPCGVENSSYTIPDCVTSLERQAFQGCKNLNSLVFGKGIDDLRGVWSECDNLITVNLSSTVSQNLHVLRELPSLTTINVDPDNKDLSSEDGVLFDKNKETLLVYPLGKKGSYVIPDSVKKLDSDAFRENHGLTSVVIPESVTSIGSSAFYACFNLTCVSYKGTQDPVYADYSRPFLNCPFLSLVCVPSNYSSESFCGVGDLSKDLDKCSYPPAPPTPPSPPPTPAPQSSAHPPAPDPSSSSRFVLSLPAFYLAVLAALFGFLL